MSLTNDLNCRVMLYARQQVKTALGDLSFDYVAQGKIWAQIKVTGGKVEAVPGGMRQAKLAHSIIIRANALPHPADDMYVVYKGHRYDVDYWRPYYKAPDRVELVCTMDPKPVEVTTDGA